MGCLKEKQSQISQEVDSISLTVFESGEDGTRLSRIDINAYEITQRVAKDGVIASINLSPEQIDIDGKRINLIGAVTVLSEISDSLATGQLGKIELVAGQLRSVHPSFTTYTSTLGFDQLNFERGGAFGGIRLETGGTGVTKVYAGTNATIEAPSITLDSPSVDFRGASIYGFNIPSHSHSGYARDENFQNLGLAINSSGYLQLFTNGNYRGAIQIPNFT